VIVIACAIDAEELSEVLPPGAAEAAKTAAAARNTSRIDQFSGGRRPFWCGQFCGWQFWSRGAQA